MEDDENENTTMSNGHGPSFVLQNIPVVTLKILDMLPAKSLNTTARVCRAWYETVKRIKNLRNSINWSWTCESCDSEDDVDMLVSSIRQFVPDLWTEPRYLIMFCSTNLYEQPLKVPSEPGMRLPRAAKCQIMEIGDLMKSLLPKSCKLLAVSADGVVGTHKNKQLTSVEIEGGHAFSCLFLPNLQDLEMFSFSVDIYTYANRMDEANSGLFDVKQVSTVPEGKDVKAILFFCDEPFCPPEIGYTLLQHYKDAVVVGGYVDNLIAPEACSHDPLGQSMASLMCIALCGSNIRVASALIKEDVRTLEEAEKAVKKIKDCNLPEENSFAFMFACVGRGRNHYGAENVESEVFRKHFPKTPLFGFFGNGEIGFNYLHKYGTDGNRSSGAEAGQTGDKTKEASTPKPLPKLYHAYTTVLCLVSVVS